MPDRKALVSRILIGSALALLAAVVAAPIRTSGFASVSSRPDCLRRNFCLPPTPTTRLSSMTPDDAVIQANALRSESDEQETEGTLPDHWNPLASPSSHPKAPEHDCVVPRPAQAYHPLRC